MRTSRRDFLAVASVATASAWALWPGRAMAPAGEALAQGHSLTVVVDERLPDSRAFAMRARVLGARIVPMRSDIGALWFETLMPTVGSTGGAIAGLTRHADAFLLTRFATSAGMRLAQQAVEGRARSDASIAWRLDAPAVHP
jgi:hypothetical protein